MGLLTQLLAQKHDTARQQAEQNFQYNKSIVMDPRKVEEGGFSDEQKQAALGNLVNIASPSKKHAQAIMPLVTGLYSAGQQQSGKSSQQPGQPSSQQPGQLTPSGPPSGPLSDPSSAVSSAPSPVPPSPMSLVGGGDSGTGNSNVASTPGSPASPGTDIPSSPGTLAGGDTSQSTPPPSASSSPASDQSVTDQGLNYTPAPWKPAQAPAQPRPMAQPQPSQPSQSSQQQPAQPQPSQSQPQPQQRRMVGDATPTTGLMNFPSQQDRLDRYKQAFDFQTKLELDRQAQSGIQTAAMNQYNAGRQYQLYQQFKQMGLSDAQAMLSAGLKPPSGAFTGEARANIAGKAPVKANEVFSTSDGQAATIGQDGQVHVVPGVNPPPVKDTAKTPTVSQQNRDAQLGAYAAAHNTTIDKLTPAQVIEATQPKDIGTLAQIEAAQRIVNDPTATAEKRAAAKMVLDQYDANLKRTNITISTDSKRLSDLNDVDSQAQAIADDIANGKRPPTVTGLGRTGLSGKVLKAIHDNYPDFNMASAEKDWQAVQAHIKTMQGPVIMRQVQSIQKVQDLMPQVEQAYAEWRKTGLPGGFSDFNKLALNAAMRLPGDKGIAARALDQQLTSLTAELSGVYMMGNTPTEEALKLAEKELGANWNSGQFAKSVGNIKTFANIRLNSINQTGVVGGNNRYDQTGQGGQDNQSQNGSTINSGAYNYKERTDIPSVIANGIKEGQTRQVKQPDGSLVTLKRYQGKIYEVGK